MLSVATFRDLSRMRLNKENIDIELSSAVDRLCHPAFKIAFCCVQSDPTDDFICHVFLLVRIFEPDHPNELCTSLSASIVSLQQWRRPEIATRNVYDIHANREHTIIGTTKIQKRDVERDSLQAI